MVTSKLDQIQSALEEAKRFVKAAEEYEEELIQQLSKGTKYSCYPSIKASNTKRKSMDLTRSLAVLRGRAK